ncbi:hypothetical protein, partial [Enterobacter hormaechei]
ILSLNNDRALIIVAMIKLTIFSVASYFSSKIIDAKMKAYVPIWMQAESMEVTAISAGKTTKNVKRDIERSLFLLKLNISHIITTYSIDGITKANDFEYPTISEDNA